MELTAAADSGKIYVDKTLTTESARENAFVSFPLDAGVPENKRKTDMKDSFFDRLSSLPNSSFSNETVLFRHIESEADLAYAIFGCKLPEEQQGLVTPASYSIGRAYIHPMDNYPCIICTLEGRPIGFINLLRWLGIGTGVTWSIYIDEEEQGKGYGKAAARLATQILKTTFPEETLKLSVVEANTRARALYLSLGFQLLDELDINDLVYGLD